MPQSPTTNMLLVQPSENGDAGTWDTILTALFALIDAHDHSTGKGVTVKSNGISINADLAFSSGGNFFVAKDLKAVDFSPTAASGMTSYSSALFSNSSDSNNLYFRNSAGTNVRITNGSSLDITASGGIAGDYIATGAEVAYSDSGKEYTFKQKDPDNFWAALRSGPHRIAQIDTTESVYVELIAPASLGSSYTITLPTAAPANESPVYMTSAGVLQTGHGDRTLNISVTSGFGNSAGLAADGGLTQFWVSGSAGSDWHIPLPLTVGDRVKSITWYYQRGAGTHTFQFRLVTLSTGAGADVGTPPTDAAGTTYGSITQSTINKTLVSTEGYYLRWAFSATNANNKLFSVQVVYDRP
jgi:hypothetical protein